MFGKPQWFRRKQIGIGLTPVSWQGWLYSMTWMVAIGAPFVWLVSEHKGLEGLVWLAAGISALSWDVRDIRRNLAGRIEDDVLVIEDDEPSHSARTNTYEFELRR